MATERAQGAALLTSAVRRRIVDHLTQLPLLAAAGEPTREQGLTAGELGVVLDLHPTTVRFHLDQLVRVGLLRSHFVRTGSAGRPAKRYAVEEGELDEVTIPSAEGPYQVLATLLADVMADQDGRRTPEQAGRAWVLRKLAERAESEVAAHEPAPAGTTGQWLGKLGTVVDLLGEWGYVPELSLSGQDGDVTLTLRDCPFLDLARVHPEIVCGVHRGLLAGALEAVGEPQAEVSLRPFVTDRTCHAVLLRQPPQPLPTPLHRDRGESA